MAHCYLLPDVAAAAEGDHVALEGPEAHHAQVARAQAGEQLWLTSGDGVLARATVRSATKARVELVVDELERHEPRHPRLTLVQALAKGDRSDVAVAAAVELGVDEIVPWQAARSVVQWRGDKAIKGEQKWRSAAAEAAKQSIRPFLTVVHPLTTTNALQQLSAQLVVLHPEATTSLDAIPLERDIALVVGPEGGISDAERETLRGFGAVEAHLGPEVLRTSTAGLAAIAALSPMLGRWQRG